ncbi:MAG: 23S rRNA (adenine(2503)-C(2))-methyltransferase RlmN [Candidatus Brocadiia bacterium]
MLLCIKDLSEPELIKWLKKHNEPPYRIKQIYQWLYVKPVNEFSQMTNLSLELRTKLESSFSLYSLTLTNRQISKLDKTEKYLLSTNDNKYIESVTMPYRDRCTVCVSTQVGCRHACQFCASGANGFVRNLKPTEILDQIALSKILGHEVTHIVFMGMGEPLDNLENVLDAIKIINSPKYFNIGARRITISTAGIPDGIARLSQTGLQVELSVSLHSPFNTVRNRLMPINKKYPIELLIKICHEYVAKTNRQITFEYILISGINESVQDAEALAALLKGLKCQVNLIAFNPHSLVHCPEPMKPPSVENIIRFQECLFKLKVHTTMRQSRGQDIDAACGQLSAKYNNP